MAPGSVYNSLAALYSLARILEHAARHRAASGARILGVPDILGTSARTEDSVHLTSIPTSTSTRTDASKAEEPSSEALAAEATPSLPPLSKAERRGIRLQLEEEEFRAILGKRWVDGVLVDGLLPFATSDVASPPIHTSEQTSAENDTSKDTNAIEIVEEKAERIAEEVEEASQQIEQDREAELKQQPIPEVVQERKEHTDAFTSSIADEVEPDAQETAPTPLETASQPALSATPIASDVVLPDSSSPPPPPKKVLLASKVPSSRIGRLLHYGGLAASLGYGAAAELLRGSDSTSNPSGNVILTEANIKRLVGKLTQMRGAALKLGQFMSIQDTHLLPPELDQIFRRVQDSAHYMPDWQMEKVLSAAYGPTWFDPSKPDETIFTEFERIPFAAASIGQVHRARLAPRFVPPELSNETTKDGLDVAVKVQFPSIVNSIKSDLGYVKMLLSVGGLLPKGLFLDRTIEVMSAELSDECSYTREASFLKKFRSEEFLGGDDRYKVPWVWEGSTDQVLVMERVGGVGVGDVSAHGVAEKISGGLEAGNEAVGEQVKLLSQSDRNDIAARIIELCLKELFEFRTMQTDPNWTNFLWNARTKQIELVDFGATRTYTKKFMDSWLRLLQAAASDDRAKCIEESINLGYLTGEEDEVMLDAHVRSLTLLATPFKGSTAQPFAFGPDSTWAEVTKDIRSLIPVMVKRRLTPPPRETYSLNRKLSGAFLLAARLDAKVDTKAVWDKIVGKYEFGGVEEEEIELLKGVD